MSQLHVYEFRKPFLKLDGEPQEGVNRDRVLASLISNSKATPEAIKWYGWATSLFADGRLLLDDEDRNKLREWVKTAETGATMALVARVLRVLENGLPHKLEPKAE